jgi:uncharacterized protein YndB with AHSA1/START domain
MAESIIVQREVAASPGEVYRYFTNGTLLREWLADVATLRAEEGGRLHLAWNDGYGMVGNFTDLVPGEKVAFTWVGSADPAASQAIVTLEPSGAGTPGHRRAHRPRGRRRRIWRRDDPGVAVLAREPGVGDRDR